jgi:hypothetical protein
VTWKRVAALQAFITLFFAVLFVLDLVLVVIGYRGGANLGNIASIAFAGFLVVGSQRLMRQAKRHVLLGDREQTGVSDFLVRLNSTSDTFAPGRKRSDVGPRVSHAVLVVGRALGKLELLRLHRTADSLANYEIWIDGQIAEEAGDDSAASLELGAGIHTVQVRIAWCRSRLHTIEIAPSVRTTMVCHSSANRLNVLFLGTFGYRRYVSLSEARRIPV